MNLSCYEFYDEEDFVIILFFKMKKIGSLSDKTLKTLKNWKDASDEEVQLAKQEIWILIPEFSNKRFQVIPNSFFHYLLQIEYNDSKFLHVSFKSKNIYVHEGSLNELFSSGEDVWFSDEACLFTDEE